jgi:Homeodomain-like domain
VAKINKKCIVDLLKIEKMEKTPAQIRIEAIERFRNKEKRKYIAASLGVHISTISEWKRMYKAGGLERLDAPIKPRSKITLDVTALETALESCADKYKYRITRLLRLADGESLKDVAASDGVSVQIVMRDRKKWLDGFFLNEIIL